jgi:glycosyltransferase involved in cell wall biosynthesis
MSGVSGNADIGKKKTTFDILYVGGLTRHKGTHILINAFKAIRYQHARLCIIGTGINERELKSLAADDARIVFYGKCSNSGLNSFYNKADIVVVPSVWYEVRSNVIPEAFRAGVAVIGSRIGAIPEFIQDGYNGFLFEPGDDVQLRKILEYVIAFPEKLVVLGNNAKDYVQTFEMSRYIERLTGIYNLAIHINKNSKRIPK